MSKRLIKKKIKNSLAVQRDRVQRLEDFIIDNMEPVICPVEHFFTDNSPGLNVCLRSFFLPKDVVITGTSYKIEVFWILVSGRIRIIEGDHVRDLEPGAIVKNLVGAKNSWYGYEDSMIYGFVPNPKNTRDITEIINTFSDIDASEIQGMGSNRQELNHQKRIENVHI